MIHRILNRISSGTLSLKKKSPVCCVSSVKPSSSSLSPCGAASPSPCASLLLPPPPPLLPPPSSSLLLPPPPSSPPPSSSSLSPLWSSESFALSLLLPPPAPSSSLLPPPPSSSSSTTLSPDHFFLSLFPTLPSLSFFSQSSLLLFPVTSLFLLALPSLIHYPPLPLLSLFLPRSPLPLSPARPPPLPPPPPSFTPERCIIITTSPDKPRDTGEAPVHRPNSSSSSSSSLSQADVVTAELMEDGLGLAAEVIEPLRSHLLLMAPGASAADLHHHRMEKLEQHEDGGVEIRGNGAAHISTSSGHRAEMRTSSFESEVLQENSGSLCPGWWRRSSLSGFMRREEQGLLG
ncbi:unnamed protein product [Pleuronectes platessa]|uniref:Uncharacterized protein n=1 Tax=Pleuronectes platessa TaxID=8262 RepID=A0A9N7UH18_PLEPL|nr:unnamed protein product [Pleuronectes platessa]